MPSLDVLAAAADRQLPPPDGRAGAYPCLPGKATAAGRVPAQFYALARSRHRRTHERSDAGIQPAP